jgi:hypothetical protein
MRPASGGVRPARRACSGRRTGERGRGEGCAAHSRRGCNGALMTHGLGRSSTRDATITVVRVRASHASAERHATTGGPRRRTPNPVETTPAAT